MKDWEGAREELDTGRAMAACSQSCLLRGPAVASDLCTGLTAAPKKLSTERQVVRKRHTISTSRTSRGLTGRVGLLQSTANVSPSSLIVLLAQDSSGDAVNNFLFNAGQDANSVVQDQLSSLGPARYPLHISELPSSAFNGLQCLQADHIIN